LGALVADRQHLFQLRLGPLSLPQYLCFLPNGDALPELIEWVRALVGFEYQWQIQLLLHADAVPSARLDGAQQLGWTTWLGRDRVGHATSQPCAPAPITGMCFEPERQFAAAWAMQA